MRAIGVLVAVLSIAATAPTAADTVDPTNKKLADAKFIEGRDQLKQGNFAAACDRFHEAQRFDEKAVVILLNLGLCYEKQGRIATALKWYRKTQTASSESADAASVKDYEDAAKEATVRLNQQVARITFVVNDLQAEAVMTIDGKEIIDRTQLTVEVDPGTRVIEAKAAGKATSRGEVVIKDKETKTYNFKRLDDDTVGAGPPRTKRRIAGISIAVGTIAIAGIATGIYANGQQNKFNASGTGGEENNPDVKGNMRLAGGVFVGAAVVGLAIGGYLFFTKPKESNRTAWMPLVTNDQVGIALGGGF